MQLLTSDIITVVFVGIIGLFIGSFLNMLIDRIPRGEQIFLGRSHCDSCKHTLGVWDLVPVFSHLALKGKCRYCSSPVPHRNTIVELLTAFLFVANYLYLTSPCFSSPVFCRPSLFSTTEFFFIFFSMLIILSMLVVVFFIDLEHHLIPDFFVDVPIVLALFIHLVNPYALSGFNYVLAALGAFGFFGLLNLVTKGKGMGGGDVKYAFFMGLFLGYPGIIEGLYVAFLTGALVSVMLILLGRKKFGQTIAFGPFLIAGTIIAYFHVITPLFLSIFPL